MRETYGSNTFRFWKSSRERQHYAARTEHFKSSSSLSAALRVAIGALSLLPWNVLGATQLPFASSFLNPVTESSAPKLELGEIRIEGQGFLRGREDRAAGATSVVVNPDWWTEGEKISARLNVQAVTLLTDRSSFTIESSDAYLSTSRKWLDAHQLSVGRRSFDWSANDERWNLGQWSPRFLWDPIRPQTVGLTGFFYTYENKDWRVLAFASPLSIPERGFPIRIEDGSLESSSPDWVPPFQQVSLMNQPIDIRYRLEYPSMDSLLVMPGAALSVRRGDPNGQGLWVQAMVGSLPMNQVDLVLEAELMAPTLTLDSTLHPRRLRHDLATLELGWNFDVVRPWVSVTGERPETPEVPEGWVASSMGPALVSSAGVDFIFPTGNRLGAQFINVRESLPVSDGAALAGASPPRYPWTDALRLSASWNGPSKFDYDFHWTYDLPNRASLITADFGFQAMQRLHLGLGADFFSAPERTGFIGQYYGNDRVRARVTYAF